MALQEYKRKRDFRRTPEPRGKAHGKTGQLYVIQKHDASHLHYDFRLELGGVLKSWAVPKGPSLDPSVKRLAVHVEDHPVEYGDFEGIIPAGEYGGGTVMLWDRGSWEPSEDAEEGYRRGRLKFRLHGEKLRGAWMLVRRGGAKDSSERNWLLFKERDDEAVSAKDGEIVEESPRSVASGRDLDEIAKDRDRTWKSKPRADRKDRPVPKAAPKRRSRPKTAGSKPSLKSIVGKRREALPKVFDPQFATLAKQPPSSGPWLHEIKFDGYRLGCSIDKAPRGDKAKVELWSRNHLSWTARLPDLVEAAGQLSVRNALFDGELVALLPDGTSSFQALQNAQNAGKMDQLVYYVFDLLHLDGYDLRGVELDQRKEILQALVPPGDAPGPIRLSEFIVGSGSDFFAEACKRGLEGIISKRRDRPYVAGRSADWLKIKGTKRQEFVIGGYTEPSGARSGFGALLVGYYNGGGLTYAGKVGTGYTDHTLRDLTKRMHRLEQDQSPFANLTGRSGAARTAHWLKPSLVAEVEFRAWTDDHKLRQPAFQGLREDKPAADVHLERPVADASEGTSSDNAPKRRKSRSSATKKPLKSKRTSKHASTGDDEFAGVRLSHPDKLLYAPEQITKRDLAQYYSEIAEWVVPQVADRPLVLVRCPEGQAKACFFQKHAGAGTPKTLRSFAIREKRQTIEYVVADDLASLISLVQIGVLEIHTWGAQIDKIEMPDRLIFDLDPAPDLPWERTVASAHQIREFLEELGLVSFVKTTGGKGLHLVVPIDRRHEWPFVREFCQQLAEAIVRAAPKQYTSNMSKAARPGKIFIDYLRNARGATAVAAYSTRARPGATVSTPLGWNELTAQLDPQAFHVGTVPRRLAGLKKDPWKDLTTTRQSITKKMLDRLQP